MPVWGGLGGSFIQDLFEFKQIWNFWENIQSHGTVKYTLKAHIYLLLLWWGGYNTIRTCSMQFLFTPRGVRVMVFDATFNNISNISWLSFIGGGNRKKKQSFLPQVTDKLITWAGFKLTTLVVIGTDCIDSCKSNYHTITTMTLQ